MNKSNCYGINGTELQWFHSYKSITICRIWIWQWEIFFTVYNYRSSTGLNSWPVVWLYMNITPECSSLFSFLLCADATPPVSHNNFNNGDSSYSPTSIINSELAKVNDWLAVNKFSLSVKKPNTCFIFASVKKLHQISLHDSLFGVQILNASATSIS